MLRIYRLALLLALVTLSATGSPAQGPGFPMRPEAVAQGLEQQPDNATLSQMLPPLVKSFKGDEDAKSQAVQLSTQAAAAGTAGDRATAHEHYLHAIALLTSRPWTGKERYAASFAITPVRQIADDATPLKLSLTQTYTASYTPESKLTLHLMLARQPAPGAPIEMPGAPAPAAPSPAGPGPARRPQLDWKPLLTLDLASADLAAKPLDLAAPLTGNAGDSFLAAEIFDGDTRLARTIVTISIVHNLASRQADIQRRLAKTKGAEVTRLEIQYPFDLARMIDTGKRKFIRYDYDRAIDRSEQLLSALEASSGKSDPLYRAKGRTEQAYQFTAAGEISPFGVYVPTTWDGHSKLKLLLILHGINEDQTSMLDRDGGIVPTAAEKHGYLVVTPNGYRTDGWYGATNKPGQPGGPTGTYTEAELKYRSLSEQDVLNVLATVEKEYPVDLTHVYLMGQSMGGAGAWHLAQKYPEKWAALVATAAAGIEQPYPFERLRGLPILCGVGTKDMLLPYTRDQAAALNSLNIPAEYHEVKDANHHSIVAEMLPGIFSFIDTHQKTPPPNK